MHASNLRTVKSIVGSALFPLLCPLVEKTQGAFGGFYIFFLLISLSQPPVSLRLPEALELVFRSL